MTRCRSAVVVFALAALLAACGGGGGGDATPTPTSPQTPAVQAEVPPRPAAFEDYPDAVAAYLTEAGDAAVATCLADLLAAWAMPEGREPFPEDPEQAGARCLAGNTDDDADDEVVVSLTSSPDDESLQQGGYVLANVVVFDRADGGYRVAYQSVMSDTAEMLSFPPGIVAAEDVNADGHGELVYTRTDCGAHTCSLTAFVLTGDGDTYRHLTQGPDDPARPIGIVMETAELTLADRDGDGAQEIVLHGGIIGSVGAGPQRARTEVHAWDGTVYALAETTYDASDLRYFTVLDADGAFAGGDYAQAAQLYDEAIEDGTLAEVEWFGSRDELLAYAGFRLGLSRLQLDDTTGASQAIEETIARYPTSLIGHAAVEFRDAINLSQAGYSGELSNGCAAVAASLNSDAARFEEAWYYGYSNPQLTPDQVCPF